MKHRMKFEYWKASNRQWYWHLKAGNGRIVAQSEGYKRRQGCLDTIHALNPAWAVAVVNL
jgi:uncharacterized protein YegP (UPF0339 family)